MFKLDFGSGYNPEKGYYKCDITRSPTIDFLFDRYSYTIIDIEDSSIDLIRCKNVIHHVKDLEHLFIEFNRVLKVGGIVNIIEPTKDNYMTNKILDIIWYRFLVQRYDIWFSNNYRDYISIINKIGFVKINEVILDKYEYLNFKKYQQI